jgi:translation initiation factor IF-3
LDIARERELDLVEISPDANPPVVKVVDWGKFNYQKTKQQQLNRKTSKTLEMKQMRFGLKIGDHDLDIKMGKVRKFLEIGHKVKVTIFYRGRELAHREIGFKLADRVINDIFGDAIVVDQQPQFAGKQLNFVIRHNPKAAKTTQEGKAESPAPTDTEAAEAPASVPRVTKLKEKLDAKTENA